MKEIRVSLSPRNADLLRECEAQMAAVQSRLQALITGVFNSSADTVGKEKWNVRYELGAKPCLIVSEPRETAAK